MEAFYADALKSGDAPGALARVQRQMLVSLARTNSLTAAVRSAGVYVVNSRGL